MRPGCTPTPDQLSKGPLDNCCHRTRQDEPQALIAVPAAGLGAAEMALDLVHPDPLMHAQIWRAVGADRDPGHDVRARSVRANVAERELRDPTVSSTAV